MKFLIKVVILGVLARPILTEPGRLHIGQKKKARGRFMGVGPGRKVATAPIAVIRGMPL
jgi:hypothetical protein